MLLRVNLGCASPDGEAPGVRPEPDRYTALVEGHFVLNFIRVNRLRADGADSACPLSCAHSQWQGHKHPSLEAIKDGLEECPLSVVIRAAGEAPPRVEPTAAERDEDLSVADASTISRNEFPGARDPRGCSTGPLHMPRRAGHHVRMLLGDGDKRKGLKRRGRSEGLAPPSPDPVKAPGSVCLQRAVQGSPFPCLRVPAGHPSQAGSSSTGSLGERGCSHSRTGPA